MDSNSERLEAKRDWFWDTYSACYDSIYRLMPYRKLLWDVFQALELDPGMRVLDAGCGTGNLERFIGEKDHPPVTIDAIDFSSSMLARARRKCARQGYVRFSQGDLNGRLPFDDDSFDRIVSVNVLYSLPDQDATLRELLRVLKPDGRLVLANPTPSFSWAPLAAEHFQRIRNVWGVSRQTRIVAASVLTLSTTAVASFVLNSLVINRREQEGAYHSMPEREMEAFLDRGRSSGLVRLGVVPAMAEQVLLATAQKALVA